MSKHCYLCLLLSLLAACALPIGEESEQCAGEEALFEDDFSGEQQCGWAEFSRGGAVVAVEDGVLQIRTSQPGQVWWTNPGRSFNDVVISTLTHQLSGPEDNAYGVICRYQSPENFYVFLISGDGYYAIGKYQSGSRQIVYLTGEGEYQFSEAINQGEATNQLRVSCIGEELTLSVNGVALATAVDGTLESGDVGLAASTFEPGATTIQFDDFRVLIP